MLSCVLQPLSLPWWWWSTTTTAAGAARARTRAGAFRATAASTWRTCALCPVVTLMEAWMSLRISPVLLRAVTWTGFLCVPGTFKVLRKGPVTRLNWGFFYFILVKWSVVFLSIFSTKGIKFLPMHFHSHILCFDAAIDCASTESLCLGFWKTRKPYFLKFKSNDPWLQKLWCLKAETLCEDGQRDRSSKAKPKLLYRNAMINSWDWLTIGQACLSVLSFYCGRLGVFLYHATSTATWREMPVCWSLRYLNNH